MKFSSTSLDDAYIIELAKHEDKRGFFARLWCQSEFKANGIDFEIVQASMSRNKSIGTIRGMHFQWAPSHEQKLVRCARGRIYDVIIDLRPDSPTFTRHIAVTLDSDEQNAILVPPGVAHGFQALTADADVQYMMDDVFAPELQGECVGTMLPLELSGR